MSSPLSSAPPPSTPEPVAAAAARRIALQMLEERGRGAVLVGVARANPLWVPLETVLSQAGQPGDTPVDPALRDYILLITILVAFLEAAAQQLRPYQPPVVMGFSGVIRQKPMG